VYVCKCVCVHVCVCVCVCVYECVCVCQSVLCLCMPVSELPYLLAQGRRRNGAWALEWGHAHATECCKEAFPIHLTCCWLCSLTLQIHALPKERPFPSSQLKDTALRSSSCAQSHAHSSGMLLPTVPPPQMLCAAMITYPDMNAVAHVINLSLNLVLSLLKCMSRTASPMGSTNHSLVSFLALFLLCSSSSLSSSSWPVATPWLVTASLSSSSSSSWTLALAYLALVRAC